MSLAIAVCSLLASGCATIMEMAVPKEDLVPRVWSKGELHCAAGDCDVRYDLAVEQAGELKIDVYSSIGKGQPDFALEVLSPTGASLVVSDKPYMRPRRVVIPVEPGTHSVRVYAIGENGSRLTFEILPTLDVGETGGASIAAGGRRGGDPAPSVGASTVKADPAPKPTFDLTPREGIAPLTVQVANRSRDAVSYEWAFGDGEVSTAANPSHTYEVPGSYRVVLSATGKTGIVRTTGRMVRVKAPSRPLVSIEILGLEPGDDGRVEVFLDATPETGLRPGDRGRLMEGDVDIAELEVLSVDVDGSRAVVVGELETEIGIDARAEFPPR